MLDISTLIALELYAYVIVSKPKALAIPGKPSGRFPNSATIGPAV
jgi:hypothetical protein